MIEQATGDLLSADAEAWVNTVNCVGVMGKGIALQFKRRFPDNYRAYAKACKAGDVVPGKMFIFSTGATSTTMGPKYIINFPTKRHWRDPSRLEDIRAGLVALIADLRRLNIHSVAIPPLGCGSGGLRWSEVEPLIQAALQRVPEVRVLVYPPVDAPRPLAPARQPGVLSRARAMLLKLIEAYGLPGYLRTRIEVQKLAYFLQEAGENLRLDFKKHLYGPYANGLDHVLVAMEGTYLRGVGDRTRRAEIQLLPGASEAAEAALGGADEARERLVRVRRLIEGLESPYGMELLATVHWVATREGAVDADAALTGVRAWSERKQERFKEAHMRKVWERLRDQGWIQGPDAAAEADTSAFVTVGQRKFEN